jgi:hypothetical protein
MGRGVRGYRQFETADPFDFAQHRLFDFELLR